MAVAASEGLPAAAKKIGGSVQIVKVSEARRCLQRMSETVNIMGGTTTPP